MFLNCFLDTWINSQNVWHHRVPDVVATILGLAVARIIDRRHVFPNTPQSKVGLLRSEERSDKLVTFMWD